MTEIAITCHSCRKPKQTLRRRKSALISNLQLMLCNECFEAKREPRWAIIIHGRTSGLEAIRPYLDQHRYVGEPINAVEFV